ncbi:hypothetical protein [Embleya sp. NPDC005971]|uniref:hypothetical protein n=1 Tax=unclassified Embleya TaxID=2699296 RepID=UPI0033D98143
MFRKMITTLAVAAATAAGVVSAAPAQAADRCSPTTRYGERICVTGVIYNRADDVSSVLFTLTGPWTDYRVSANGKSALYYPGNNALGVNGHLTTSVCVSEATTHWLACV